MKKIFLISFLTICFGQQYNFPIFNLEGQKIQKLSGSDSDCLIGYDYCAFKDSATLHFNYDGDIITSVTYKGDQVGENCDNTLTNNVITKFVKTDILTTEFKVQNKQKTATSFLFTKVRTQKPNSYQGFVNLIYSSQETSVKNSCIVAFYFYYTLDENGSFVSSSTEEQQNPVKPDDSQNTKKPEESKNTGKPADSKTPDMQSDQPEHSSSIKLNPFLLLSFTSLFFVL